MTIIVGKANPWYYALFFFFFLNKHNTDDDLEKKLYNSRKFYLSLAAATL